MPETFDVIIIGAGSIGAPAAFYLANAGYKTVVLENSASVGQGSNKKAIGGIRATHSDPAKIRLCQRSIEIFSTWKEAYGDDIEWCRGGYCFVAYREQEEKALKTLARQQQDYGLNIQWLEPADLMAAIPDLNPAGLLGGTLSPDDGSASPLLATHAFYEQARRRGVEFRFREPVTGFKLDHSQVTTVHTNQGSYSAAVVINAAGAWAKQVARLADVDVPVNPDMHEAAVTEPVAHFFKPMIVDIRPAVGSSNYYFYQHSTGQIFFCITPSPNLWGYNTEETSSFLPMVSKRMIEVMPRLKNIRVRRTWRGLYPMTPDGYPIVGWAGEVQNFLLAVGMCGQGFMLGPGLGELITRIVQNGLDDSDRQTLSYIAPDREYGRQELLK